MAGTLAKMIVLLLVIQTMIAASDERFSVMGESLQDQITTLANATNPFTAVGTIMGIAGNIIGVPLKLAQVLPSQLSVLIVMPLIVFIGIGGYKLLRRGT